LSVRKVHLAHTDIDIPRTVEQRVGVLLSLQLKRDERIPATLTTYFLGER
jgi:hypothetical protein